MTGITIGDPAVRYTTAVPNEENISTQEALSPARPRLSSPDEHPRRRPRGAEPPSQGPPAPDRI